MRNPVLVAWVCVVILAGCGGGCASSNTNKNNEAPAEPKPALRAMGESVEAGETVSNEEIGFEIRRRLNNDPAATAGIIVEVDEGKVILRGRAPNLATAWRAEAAARSVKGVKQVVNQILVAGSGP